MTNQNDQLKWLIKWPIKWTNQNDRSKLLIKLTNRIDQSNWPLKLANQIDKWKRPITLTNERDQSNWPIPLTNYIEPALRKASSSVYEYDLLVDLLVRHPSLFGVELACASCFTLNPLPVGFLGGLVRCNGYNEYNGYNGYNGWREILELAECSSG